MLGSDLRAQVDNLAGRHSMIFDSIDQDRVRARNGPGAWGDHPRDDFGSAAAGGRGETYVVAQRSLETRVIGISGLLDLITRWGTAESPILVDLLGGDGLVSRVVSLLGRDEHVVVTCDASPFMVGRAWSLGEPALLQRAECPLFRDESVGSVLLAYGSHHIPVESRPRVAMEALRILQPGGVFVVHDFPPCSPTADWFRAVVDVFSTTGHRFDHFARDETLACVAAAGFADVQAFVVDDAFVASGATRYAAERALGRYLVEMYGLVRLVDRFGEEGASRRAFELAANIFRYDLPGGGQRSTASRYDSAEETWRVSMPREALVVVGRKVVRNEGR